MTCLSKQTYKPGDDVLINCQPFIRVLDKYFKETRCDYCFKHRFLKRCQGCKQMQYCSKTCQNKDWKDGHKLECKFSPFAEGICNNPNWAVLRIVFRLYSMIKMNPEKASNALPLPDGSSRSFNNLMDHSESEKNNPQLVSVFSALKDLMVDQGHQIETDYLVELYSVYKTNGFSIYNETGTAKIGYGLYIQPSIFDHSCKPNVIYWILGTEMKVRTIGPIAVGESICISYIASHNGRDDRRRDLEERFRFVCNCERCTANLDSDVDFDMLQRMIESFQFGAESLINRNKFTATLEKHQRIMKILRLLYHEYDDRITNQYVRMLEVINTASADDCANNPFEKSEVEPVLKEIVDHVLITYGPDHFEYTELFPKVVRCGFVHLLSF